MPPINIKDINDSLADAGLTAEELKSLSVFLPSVGQNVREFLYGAAQSSSFSMLNHAIFNVVWQSWEAISELQKGNEDIAKQIAPASLASSAFNFGRWAIPMVMDIRQLQRTRKISLSEELDGILNRFELAMFRYLPLEEKQDLVRDHLLFLLKGNLDVLMELKSGYLVASITAGPDWLAGFRKNLESNQEMLGQQSITVDGKSVTPAVANWLQDYLISSPKFLGSRTAFEEVQYAKTSPNVKKLTLVEQQMLMKVIRLYSWLANPVVSAEEVDAYEDSRSGKQEGAEDLINEKLDELKQKVH